MRIGSRITLKTRITLLSGVGIIAMAASLLFYDYKNTEQIIMYGAAARAQILAQNTVNALAIPRLQRDEATIRAIVQSLGQYRDVQYARAVSRRGRIIAQIGDYSLEDRGVIRIDEPIIYRVDGHEIERLGVLILQMNTVDQARLLHEHLIITAIVYLLIALCICYLISSLLARALRPLENLSEAMTEYAQGNRSVKVESNGAAPEIRNLVNRFTTMHKKVDNYQTNLEREVEQRTAELQEAMKAAEAANRTKSAFLATVGHEIRTPLNGIIGMADVLTRRDLGTKENECARVIFGSGKTLLGMINNILDFSKAEAGKITMDMQKVKLAEIVTEAATLMRQLAEEKKLKLEIKADPTITVKADKQYIKQCLFNLINNAIKFTDTGSVTISLDRIGDEALITVADTGIGISEAGKEKLFQAFTQIDDGSNRRYEGTGLGLAICQRFIGQMGGKIGVESEAGKGSRFWISLPTD